MKEPLMYISDNLSMDTVGNMGVYDKGAQEYDEV